MTEYVQGDRHEAFIAELASHGMPFAQISKRTVGHNQILIASKLPLLVGDITGPDIHPAVPPNTLHVIAEDLNIQVLGFRMPAFESKDMDIKRAVWEWLIAASRTLESHRGIMTGDLNTAIGDSKNYCGDCLPVLPEYGWQHAIPADGFSWKSVRHGTVRRIDHTFLSPFISTASARYLWGFEAMSPDAGSGRVGIPDHAMLIVDF